MIAFTLPDTVSRELAEAFLATVKPMTKHLSLRAATDVEARDNPNEHAACIFWYTPPEGCNTFRQMHLDGSGMLRPYWDMFYAGYNFNR